jgi:hypothetical protein
MKKQHTRGKSPPITAIFEQRIVIIDFFTLPATHQSPLNGRLITARSPPDD